MRRKRDPNNPSDVFFWKDWENDEGLKVSCLAAQGLWMRLLCLAAKSEPVGVVVVNGNPVDAAMVARIASIPEAEAQDLLSELERNGVFSRDKQGRIFSRKMVKQNAAAKKARKNGLKGGNPALLASAGKQTENTGQVNLQDKDQDKPPLPIPNPRGREEELSDDNSPPPPVGGGGFSDDDFDRLLTALGYDPDGHIPAKWVPDSPIIAVWLERLTPAQIIAAAKDSRAVHAEPPATPQALNVFMDQAAAKPAAQPRPTNAQIMAAQAERINSAKFCPPSIVTPSQARALINAGLVTIEKLKERGIAA